jgi:hypothetical protein
MEAVRVTVARAELAAAARILREAVKDKSYRSTPLGLEVGRYCRWKRNEWGATTETMRDYEAILAKLALDHADLELSDFAPPIGTERLREFIDNRWGDKTARTRAKVISVLRDFFAWAVREGRLVGNRLFRSSGLAGGRQHGEPSRRVTQPAWWPHRPARETA